MVDKKVVRNPVLGVLVVYVDDFLLQTEEGKMRDSLLAELKKIWTLTKEETLTESHPITFLGTYMEMKKVDKMGDYKLQFHGK